MFSASSHSSRLRAPGASSVHVERSCGTFDDLLRDHNLLDTFETRQFKHSVGIVGVAAAIANAVFHATGKRVRDLPITLDKLMK